jgi:DNA polymerase-1
MAKKASIEGIEFERHDIVALPAAMAAFELLRRQRVLGYDIETLSLDPRQGDIRCVQYAYEDEKGQITAFVFDLFAVPEAWDLLRPLLETGEHVIVGQNLTFEATWAWDRGVRLRAPLFDTMLADKILHNGKPEARNYRNLADLCEDYLGLGLDKTLQTGGEGGWGAPAPGELSEAQWNYAALDAVVVLPLRKELKRRLQAPCGDQNKKPRPITQEAWEDERARATWPHKPAENLMLVAAIEMAALPAFAGMSYFGMVCDMQEWDRQTELLELAAEEAYDRMVAAFDERSEEVSGAPLPRNFLGELEFSFTSTPQLISVFDQLRLPVPVEQDKKTKEEKRTLDQNKLKDGYSADYPTIAAFLRWKELHTSTTKAHKQKEYIHPVSGRVHPNYNQLGAATGRVSCKSPNIQQISKALEAKVNGEDVKIDFRRAYASEPGWLMVNVDLDQIELRLPGPLAPDDAMGGQFFDPKCDPHSNTARRMNDIPDDVPVPKASRTAAKIVNFSSLYLISPPKLRSYAKSLYNVDMTVEEADANLAAFRSAYPGVAAWQEWCKQEARLAQNMAESRSFAAGREDGDTLPAMSEVFTVSGRRRYLVGDDVTAPNLAATRIQGSGADLIKTAMGWIYDRLEAAGCERTRLVGMVHDSLMLACPEEEALLAGEVAAKTLSEAGDYLLKGLVPITASPEIGPNWGECKAVA